MKKDVRGDWLITKQIVNKSYSTVAKQTQIQYRLMAGWVEMMKITRTIIHVYCTNSLTSSVASIDKYADSAVVSVIFRFLTANCK